MSKATQTNHAPSGPLSDAAQRSAPQHGSRRFPLSFAQARLYFVEQVTPGSPLYVAARVHRIRGRLDADALGRALDAVVARHASLRARFYAGDDGEPYQLVSPPASVSLERADLSGRREPRREADARMLIEREVRRPFDLARDLMLRALLLRLAEDEHTLVLSLHHIASDGWSVGILNRELSACYRAFLAGGEPELPELPIQYPDFAAWQRDRFSGERLQQLVEHWTRRLAGIPPLLRLPADHPRPAVATHNGGSVRLAVPSEVVALARALAGEEGCSLFMVLLASLAAWLRLVTGQEDIVVGSPVAGRTRIETEPLIGLFVNTLVFRTDASGDPTFRELMWRVRTVVLDALDHQELPFEKLVEVVRPQRGAAPPLVQVSLALHNLPGAPLELDGATVVSEPADTGTAKTDATFYLAECDGALTGHLEYASDLFEPETAQRFVTHFCTVLAQAVAEPDGRISSLPRLESSIAVAPAPAAVRSAVATADAAGTGELDHIDELAARSNLTRNQILIWAGQRLHPSVPMYNVPFSYTLRGALDPARFRQAFAALIEESDALRTVIVEEDGVPWQRVLPRAAAGLRYLDFSGRGDAAPEAEHWLAGEVGRPLDPATSLFDAALLRLDERTHIFWLVTHHLISDGLSQNLAFRRIAEWYAFLGGGVRPAPLPAFADFVARERARAGEPETRSAREFWRRRLAALPEPLAFYGVAKERRGTQVVRLGGPFGSERARALHDAAAHLGLTRRGDTTAAFNILAAALLAWVHRVTGSRDIGLGVPFHNRRGEEEERAIGLFMHVLPLRASVDPAATFVALANQVAAEAIAARRHGAWTPANPPHHKAYDVVLNFHITRDLEFPGAEVARRWHHPGHEEDAVALQIHDYSGGNLRFELDLHADVFDGGRRERAVGHFLAVLDACLADPCRHVGDVDLLSRDERGRVLVAFQGTPAPPRNETVAALFDRQALATPKRTAIVCQGRRLRYRELHARVLALAARLSGLGVGREVIAGICVERSPDLVAAVLAVLTAGGAFLPIDPATPSERIAFMLRDAGCPLLLTTRELATRLPSLSVQRVLVDEPATTGTALARPPAGPSPDDVAYVIYTSGSTGEPNGVVVTHRAVVNLLLEMQRSFPLDGRDAVLHQSSFGFDAAVWQILAPLIAGARLVLARPGGEREPAYLVREMARERVTVLDCVPALLQALLDEPGFSACASLRLVFCGGEAMPVALKERFLAASTAELYNCYGPTEATVQMTVARCQRGGGDSAVPIGRPIGGARAYVLDDRLRPQPLGVPGEIYIGGACLARGYLNRPALTAERFIPDPFGGAGDRLFRTGDRGRFRADGSLEFLGRLDDQVKLRGFRIELGEVEAALLRHHGIREAAVARREEAGGGARLVAYLVPAGDPPPGAEVLGALLRQRLPDYMIPASFVVLPALPRTASGKLDRRALPEPFSSEEGGRVPFVAPRDAFESGLAKIWGELLGVPQVGAHDNFFDLGGHSLLAARLFARIEKRFGRRLPLATLFTDQTIERLAARLRDAEAPAASSCLVPIRASGSRPPLFWVHAAGGHVLSYRVLASYLGEDQPVYGLQSPETIGRGLRFDGIEATAAHYLEEIRRVQPEGPYYLGGLSTGGVIAYEMAQQLVAAGARVALLALLDTYAVQARRGLGERLALAFRQRFEFHRGNLSVMGPGERVDYLARRFAAVPSKLLRSLWMKIAAARLAWDARLPRQLRAIWRVNVALQRRYERRPYPGKVTLFVAASRPRRLTDPSLGWGELALGGVEVVPVPGHHVSIIAEPNVRHLAERLRACLDRAV